MYLVYKQTYILTYAYICIYICDLLTDKICMQLRERLVLFSHSMLLDVCIRLSKEICCVDSFFFIYQKKYRFPRSFLVINKSESK